MSEELWSSLDAFYARVLHANDPAMENVLAASRDAGLRNIAVSRNHGKMLMLLVMATGARRILEIGTLGGYSALWMARGLSRSGGGGTIITLENDPEAASVARRNIEAAGASATIEIRVGDARSTLGTMVEDNTEPFDLVFIDADRENMPAYIELAVALSRPGTMIIADNVVRRGYVADVSRTGADLQGVRQFLDRAGNDRRLECTVVQTVGDKGHDGFAICVVQPGT